MFRTLAGPCTVGYTCTECWNVLYVGWVEICVYASKEMGKEQSMSVRIGMYMEGEGMRVYRGLLGLPRCLLYHYVPLCT